MIHAMPAYKIIDETIDTRIAPRMWEASWPAGTSHSVSAPDGEKKISTILNGNEGERRWEPVNESRISKIPFNATETIRAMTTRRSCGFFVISRTGGSGGIAFFSWHAGVKGSIPFR
jgi:hypothetical protein